MKTTLKAEELFMFLLSIYLFSLLDYKWFWYPALILAPDVGMIGYAFNPKIGARAYNALHHKGVAVALYLAGVFLQVEIVQLAGVIMFGHACMDRIFGYGLKYPDSFHRTHLGTIGAANQE